jgi:8-oxo-dGTP pyrophosphatase MutT (NUDIX family)
MSDSIELAGREILLDERRFRLCKDRFQTPVGLVEKHIVYTPGSVAMVVQPDPEHVVLVHQYRYPIRAWTWEIPAGTRESDEVPLVTAQRELAEEAGLAARTWVEWFRFHPSYGYCDEEMIVYHATDLSPAQAEPDHGELIRAEVVPLTRVPELVQGGGLNDAKTLLALSHLPGVPAELFPGPPPC